MEIKFSKPEQEAIVSVLCILTKADYRTPDKEKRCLRECIEEIGFDDESFEPFTKSQLEVKAFEPLRKMSKQKKKAFSLMMTKIARSDGHFGHLERTFVVEILDRCEIPFIHRVES